MGGTRKVVKIDSEVTDAVVDTSSIGQEGENRHNVEAQIIGDGFRASVITDRNSYILNANGV